MPQTHLTPTLLRMGLLLRGLAAGRPAGRPLRVLELGCGQGLALSLLAASAPGEYWGADDNPDHILRARERARAAGLDLHLLNKSTGELTTDKELPVFDVILLSDVWSPAGPDGRRHILELLDSRLATGGFVVMDYAALPGWFAASGPRDLAALLLGAGKNAPLGQFGILTRLAELGTTTEEQAGIGFFARQPESLGLVNAMRGAQGLPACFMANWQPFHFADVARNMGLARLGWGGPANMLDGLDAVNIPATAQPLLDEQNDPILRETLRDYLLNRNRRHDVFVKGELRLNQRERMDAVGKLRVGLACALEGVPASFVTPMGPCTLKEDLYKPVLAALADKDYAPKTVEELEDHPLLVKLDSSSLLEALVVLAGLGVLAAVPEGHDAAEVRPRCEALNATLLEQARSGEDAPWLASPVLGCGVPVSGLEQLFLASMLGLGGKGKGVSAKEWGEDAWAVLGGLGRQLLRDNEPLSYEESEAEMTRLAETFAAERLPYLRAVGVASGSAENGESGDSGETTKTRGKARS